MVYWRRGTQGLSATPSSSPAAPRQRRRISLTGAEGTQLLTRIISPFSRSNGVDEIPSKSVHNVSTAKFETESPSASTSTMISVEHSNNTPTPSRPTTPARERSCRKLSASAGKMMARIVPNHVQEDDSDHVENPAIDAFEDSLQQDFSTRSATPSRRRGSLSSAACNFDFTAITRQLSTAKLTISRRVAVVTGANRGIGFYTAVRLADSGKFDVVVLACRNPNRGFRAVRKVTKYGQIATSATKVVHMPLVVGDEESHSNFRRIVEERYGHIDLLVNNAATASKAGCCLSEEEQCRQTLDVNFRGTVDLTDELLPLLRRAPRGQVINIVSEAGRLDQLRSEHLRDQFSSPKLSMLRLRGLIDQYERDAATGMAEVEGWGTSNYAMSKLALIAATRIWARQEDNDPKSKVVVNCCCPGFCKTDLNSRMGDRTPWQGSKVVLKPAFMKKPPTGEFFSNMLVTEW